MGVCSAQRRIGSLDLACVLLLLIMITTDTECESVGTESLETRLAFPPWGPPQWSQLSAWDTQGQNQPARGFGITIKPSVSGAVSNLGNLCEWWVPSCNPRAQGCAIGHKREENRGISVCARLCVCVCVAVKAPHHVPALFIPWSIKPHRRCLRLSESWTPIQMFNFWLISKKLGLLWPNFLYTHQWILNYKLRGRNFQWKMPPVHFVGLI